MKIISTVALVRKTNNLILRLNDSNDSNNSIHYLNDIKV